MEDLPFLNARGERARLFPVLSEKSREGRTLSAFLAVLTQVREFSNTFLRQVGQPIGVRANVSTFTEVSFPKSSNPKVRPDGLIVVEVGKRVWTAFVEAKVANEELRQDQIETYLTLAREVGVDAVITISNQYTSTPEKNPVTVNGRLLRSVNLYHFSWFSILTQLNVLSEGEDVEDNDHTFLLDEFERFLVHDSAGLKRFTQMGQSWGKLLDRIRSGLTLSKSNDEVQSVVEDWQAEVRDLCLYLTRKTGESVVEKVPPKVRNDAEALTAMHLEMLTSANKLVTCLSIPNAATTLDIEADLATRTLHFSSSLKAPSDKKRQASRVNWLIWQIPNYEDSEVRVRSLWPSRTSPIETTISEANADNSIHSHPDRSVLPRAFSLIQKMEDGRKFVGAKTFITELEDGALDFYESVLCHLKAYVPPAPKIRNAVEEEI